MSKDRFKIGDRVKMSPMWKYASAVGDVIKITGTYVIVRWDEVNGDWHYTHGQAQKLESI